MLKQQWHTHTHTVRVNSTWYCHLKIVVVGRLVLAKHSLLLSSAYRNRIPLHTSEHRILFTNVEFPKQILSLPSKNSVRARESSRVTVVHTYGKISHVCAATISLSFPPSSCTEWSVSFVVCFCKSTYTCRPVRPRPRYVLKSSASYRFSRHSQFNWQLKIKDKAL